MIKKLPLLLALHSLLFFSIQAQMDSSLLKTVPADSSKQAMNMDAIYNRPFLSTDKLPLSMGGYLEVNWQHLSTDGISEGHQFQFRRMSLFMASTISRRIKFLAEIEFENDEDEVEEGGGTEIGIEFAAIDFEFDHMLNLRGGVILNPIGAFNQNHDGPKWEFTDRPIAMTQMLPGTWSNAGFGLYGKKYTGDWMFGYEIYLTGGFNGDIIDNEHGKTFLPAAKESSARFVTTESGEPLYTGKISLRKKQIGELGISYMTGIYNKFQEDGLIIDDKRSLAVFALDFNTTITKTKTRFVTEWAWVKVEIPATYTQQYGTNQYGGFLDIIQPILSKPMFGWQDAVLNLACRLEYVDWNVGTFNDTGDKIGDELWSIVPAISFRPTSQTVLRLNYRFLRQNDLFNNPPSTTAGFNFGISSYF